MENENQSLQKKEVISCKWCARNISASAKFCNHCGKNVSGNDEQVAVQESELVNCYWCAEPIKPLAKICKHCGKDTTSQEPNDEVAVKKEIKEDDVNAEKVIDFIFALIYLYLGYIVFFSGEMGELGVAGFIGVIIALAMVAFVQKVIKSVVGTISRAFK